MKVILDNDTRSSLLLKVLLTNNDNTMTTDKINEHITCRNPREIKCKTGYMCINFPSSMEAASRKIEH